MMNELGRELTAAESIAVAKGQTTIMDILHEVALEMDEIRRQEVAVIMPSGTIITRGALEDEIRSTRTPRPTVRMEPTLILGLNSSTNMFA